jgi:putative dTDP-4-keto-6-deoxyglucose-3, 5-epimerase and dTDP-6-deoxy-L-mannose-dehydrogenase
MKDSEIFIIGANGQLGLALQKQYPGAVALDHQQLDITDQKAVNDFDWSHTKVIINAAAFTNVDGAESADGRKAAWRVNATAVGQLAKICIKHDIALVYISTDYIFDGQTAPHTEDEPLSPLSAYGTSKAAGDIAACIVPKHYIIRTSWVVGEGKNFVRTMLNLAERGISPTVVADQVGRLTFANELARAIDYLLSQQADYGIYNVTNNGPLASWADIARKIFEFADYTNLTVTDTTTAEYFAGKDGIAPRPLNSDMSLDKLHSTGFSSRDWLDELKEYIIEE